MWSPEIYERFRRERRQPFDDLRSLIVRQPAMRIADLGCGTGSLTRELHAAFEAASTTGVDSSAAMLAEAATQETPTLRFVHEDLGAFHGGPFDLVLSNAAFHWLPDHERLFARITSMLAPAGQLAVQMPANDAHPSHRIAAEVARAFGLEPRPATVLAPADYARLLYRLGFATQHVRLQVYGHLLPSSEDVVEWNRGALLTHYQSQLDAAAWDQFLGSYRERLLAVLGLERPFFYTYDRILIHATRPPGPAHDASD
jgi:trans-aconitate 2-methyltransferase